MTDADAQRLAERVVDAMMARDAFSQWLGIEILEVAPQRSTCRLTVRSEMVNGFGVTHGGVAFSLADSAFAFACNSYGESTVAAAASIDFLAAVREGDVLTATARELWRGGRRFLSERAPVVMAELRDSKDAAVLRLNPVEGRIVGTLRHGEDAASIGLKQHLRRDLDDNVVARSHMVRRLRVTHS